MASDVGAQVVTIRFHRPVDSDVVNMRFKDIRALGIYKGGYLTKTGGLNVSLSPLVCEISDGTYQVRVETTIAVTKALAVATPYLVLNWAYTGSVDTDYMVIETKSTPDTNDLVIGKGNISGGVVTSIDYSERTTPNAHHLFLRVEEMETPNSSVRVRAGVGHAGSTYNSCIDQVVDLSGYAAASTIYVYVNDTGGVTHSATVANYVGKALLAKIVMPADGIIENSDIVDARSFVTSPAIPDESSITRSSTGKLEVKDLGITNDKIHSNVVDGTTIEKDGSTGKLQVSRGVVIPRWKLEVHPTNNLTLPSQFTTGIVATGSFISLGTLMPVYTGSKGEYGSWLLSMYVNNISGTSINKTIRFKSDNFGGIYIDGVLIYSQDIGAITDVILPIATGQHLVQIVHSDYGGINELWVYGDIIDNTNILFVDL